MGLGWNHERDSDPAVIASEIGAEYVPKRGSFELRLPVAGHTMVITPTYDEGNLSALIGVTEFVNRDGVRFQVLRRSLFSIGDQGRPVKIGDPSFDDRYLLTGNEPELLVRLFSRPEVQRLCQELVLDRSGALVVQELRGIGALASFWGYQPGVAPHERTNEPSRLHLHLYTSVLSAVTLQAMQALCDAALQAILGRERDPFADEPEPTEEWWGDRPSYSPPVHPSGSSETRRRIVSLPHLLVGCGFLGCLSPFILFGTMFACAALMSGGSGRYCSYPCASVDGAGLAIKVIERQYRVEGSPPVIRLQLTFDASEGRSVDVKPEEIWVADADARPLARNISVPGCEPWSPFRVTSERAAERYLCFERSSDPIEPLRLHWGRLGELALTL